MNTGIKLSYEIADAITLATLIDSKAIVQESIDQLLVLTSLEENEKIDLQDNLAILHHMTAVIKYFGG